MSRAAWFLAGAGAGVYALTKARRTAEAFTPDGMRDRVNGLFAGARVFVEEFQSGRAEAESDLRTRIDDRMLAIAAGDAAEGTADLSTPDGRALHAVPPPSDDTSNPTPDKKGTHR